MSNVSNKSVMGCIDHKISPRPSLLKRGSIPPFGKGRLGGILPAVTTTCNEGLLKRIRRDKVWARIF